MNDLGLDSLDHVEIITAIEDEFGKLNIIKANHLGSVNFYKFKNELIGFSVKVCKF